MFGLLYYLLQYIDSQPFAINRTVDDEQLHIFSSQPYTLQTNPNLQPIIVDSAHSHTHFSLMSCMHFSLVTQSTLGYDSMIPISRTCILINSLQLMSIFWITAI